MTEFRGAVVRGAFEGLRRWRRRDKAVANRRKAIAELDALDDRTLQDIGVNRRSIRDLVDAQLQAEDKAEAETADPRQERRDPVPGQMGLGIAVEQQERRPVAAEPQVQLRVAERDAPRLHPVEHGLVPWTRNPILALT